MADFDIIVCGAGPVGLALGLLLVKRGVSAKRIAIIDGKELTHASADPRSLALSYGSKKILEQIGAWPIVADAIHEIHVSRRGHFGRTLIDRKEFDLPALGYVTRYGALITALAQAADHAGLTVLRPVQVTALEESTDVASVALPDSRNISADIVVQAEGGVFSEQQGSGKALHRDYDQTAIVAQVWGANTLPHRAFERFTDEGPLALLPQDDGYALVWCVRPARAQHLLALDDAAFLAALTNAFGSRLGKFIRITPRASFPLALNAQPAQSARIVAIGNAAQTLHPVAGQGLNLGLRDATVLAHLLAKDCSPTAIVNFVNRRQSDRKLTIHVTDGLARLFASAPDGALSQSLLGISLGIVDAFKPAKNILAAQMMFGWR